MSRHLLFVDDDPGLFRLAARLFPARGWQVTLAEDADAALLAAASGWPRLDLIVTDYDMPGLDGLYLIDRIRGRFPGLAAILTSGCAPAVGSEILADRKILFVEKPFSFKSLMDCADLLAPASLAP